MDYHEIEKAAEVFINGAKENLLIHGYLTPVTFIVAKRTPAGDPLPTTQIVPCVIHAPDADAFRAAQQELVKTCEAEAVLLLTEATEQRLDTGALQDQILLLLEHVRGRCERWSIDIFRDGPRVTFGEVVRSHEHKLGGRMTGYFPATRLAEA